MKKILIVLILLCCSIGIWAQQSVVSLDLINTGKDTLTLTYDPLFLGAKAQKGFFVAASGISDAFQFGIAEEGIVDVSFRGKTFHIYLERGNQIKIKIDGKNWTKALQMEGSLSAENMFLQQFNEKFADSFNTAKVFEQMKDIPIDSWEMALFDAKKAQSDFYKKTPNLEKFSPKFKQYIENQIRWNYWNYLLAYPIVKGNTNTALTKVMALPNTLITDLDTKKLQDEALLSDSYRSFLSYYVTYFNSKAHDYEKYKDQSKSMTDKHNFAREHLPLLSYQYYLAYLLYNNCDKVLPSVARSTFAALSVSSTADAWSKIIKEKCGVVLGSKDVEISKVLEAKDGSFRAVNLKGDSISLSSLKGKILYIDFWATWCKPCIEEFPYSKKLMQAIPNKFKKDIEFLYISVDETEGLWKRGVEKHGLQDGLNLFSQGGWFSDAAKRFKLQAIPRYLIINKKGEILYENAKRPSDPRTLGELIQLLEEK
jgi:thiol-disulfide isomerase/thioredoxin